MNLAYANVGGNADFRPTSAVTKSFAECGATPIRPVA